MACERRGLETASTVSRVCCMCLGDAVSSVHLVHIALAPDTVSATGNRPTVVAQQSIPRSKCDPVPLSILPPPRSRLFGAVLRHKRGA